MRKINEEARMQNEEEIYISVFKNYAMTMSKSFRLSESS